MPALSSERKLVFSALQHLQAVRGTRSKANALCMLFETTQLRKLPELPEPPSARPVILPVFQNDARHVRDWMKQVGGNVARCAAAYFNTLNGEEGADGRKESRTRAPWRDEQVSPQVLDFLEFRSLQGNTPRSSSGRTGTPGAGAGSHMTP
jgi:hypothetical protein